MKYCAVHRKASTIGTIDLVSFSEKDLLKPEEFSIRSLMPKKSEITGLPQKYMGTSVTVGRLQNFYMFIRVLIILNILVMGTGFGFLHRFMG
jgi:hypothetical protein